MEDILSFCDHAGPGESHRDAFGRLLLEENLRSVRARYPDTAVEELAGPGPLTFDAGPQGVALHDPLTILQACECFDYQACETRDYRSTWAAETIDRIRRAACTEVLQDMRIPDRMSGWPIQTEAPDPGDGLAPRYHPRRRIGPAWDGRRPD